MNSPHLRGTPKRAGGQTSGRDVEKKVVWGPGIKAYFDLVLCNLQSGNDALQNQRKICWMEEQIWTSKVSVAYLSTPSLGILTPTPPIPPNSQPGLFACHFRNLRPVRGTGRLGCSQLAGSSLNHSSFLSQDLSHQPFLLLTLNRCLVPGRPSISWLSSPKVLGPASTGFPPHALPPSGCS